MRRKFWSLLLGQSRFGKGIHGRRVKAIQRNPTSSSNRNVCPDVHNRQDRVGKGRNCLVQEANLGRGTSICVFWVHITRVNPRSISWTIDGQQPTLRSGLHQPITVVHMPPTPFHRILGNLHGAKPRDGKEIVLYCRLVDGAKPTGRIYSTNNWCAVSRSKLTRGDHAVDSVDSVRAPELLQIRELFCIKAPLRIPK